MLPPVTPAPSPPPPPTTRWTHSPFRSSPSSAPSSPPRTLLHPTTSPSIKPEPDKHVLLSWLSSPGRRALPPPRRALLLADVGAQTHEIIVDRTSKRLVSDRILYSHGYPILTIEEQIPANNLALKYGPLVAAMKAEISRLKRFSCTLTEIFYGGSNYRDEEYGILVAENTIGSRHDHFLTYHLDLDIDGEANSFLKSTLQMTKVDAQESPRRSYWKVISEKAKTESDARIRLGLDQAELLFVNPSKRTRIGSSASPLLSSNDYAQIRGSFTNYNVWVTPYNKSEKWAGGPLTDQSHGDDTLSSWTQCTSEKWKRELSRDDVMEDVSRPELPVI
ncbi:hypothetical protein SAY87_028219 [Trapa incisa]|uniref:Amine oxidase n=1 Tax=Trapa incisa TaxID=236973 RepID=A0AAN7L0U1_9MYRT|nr:hypothetical protein SAY87_028219 [Trapa incisa]